MTLAPTKPAAAISRVEKAIREYALSFPEVREDFPWGHSAFKVKGKTFLFMGAGAEGLGLSTKLPASGVLALELPFTEPTHYGLGKSGWVSAKFGPKDEVPLGLLREWIDESYRAIAPKGLVKGLPGRAAPEPPRAAKPAGRAAPAPKKRAAPRTNATKKRSRR